MRIRNDRIPSVSITNYFTLDGDDVDLGTLRRSDLAFVIDLARRALDGEDSSSIELRVCGRGAYPLRGGRWVTKRIYASPLFRVAQDIAFRAGIQQGRYAREVRAVRAAPAKAATRRVSRAAARTARTRGSKGARTYR